MSGCQPAVIPVRARPAVVTTNNQTNVIDKNEKISITNNQTN